MKTLQEQYQLIKEGKGHVDVFMKSARRLFPQFISNVTSYDNAVTILKQKQVLSEGIGGVVTAKSANPFINWAQFLAEEAKVEEKKPTKEVTDMETRDFDYKDKKNIDNVYGQEFLEGYYAEMKDPKNEKKTVDELKAIVAKNLAKDATYYTTNQAFGIKGIGYTDEAPGLTASKTDQMTPVKIKENMIKLTDLLNEGIGGYIDIRPTGLGNTYSESVAEAEDKKEKEEHYRDAEKDDAAHIEDLEKDMEDDKKADKKIEKEGLENRLRQIEVAGNVAALEAKMNAIDEEIAAREGKLAMVQENEAIAEFINPTRIKEINREIKELQKAQAKYGKLYEKVAGKAYVKKEVVDETDELGY
jgi:hypothetical protein